MLQLLCCLALSFSFFLPLSVSVFPPCRALRKRLFPESKILHWFVQIALGLHYMHGRLVLHRDLKTQNIFLLGNGRLVLGDLGISKASRWVASERRPWSVRESLPHRRPSRRKEWHWGECPHLFVKCEQNMMHVGEEILLLTKARGARRLE